MNAAPCSCRVVTNLIELSSSASMMSMFSSPGMPKMYSTPSFSRHFTSNWAAVIRLSKNLDVVRWRVRSSRQAANDPARKLLRGRLAAKIAGAHIVFAQGPIDRCAQSLREVGAVHVLEHQGCGEERCQWVGDALARPIVTSFCHFSGRNRRRTRPYSVSLRACSHRARVPPHAGPRQSGCNARTRHTGPPLVSNEDKDK